MYKCIEKSKIKSKAAFNVSNVCRFSMANKGSKINDYYVYACPDSESGRQCSEIVHKRGDIHMKILGIYNCIYNCINTDNCTKSYMLNICVYSYSDLQVNVCRRTIVTCIIRG